MTFREWNDKHGARSALRQFGLSDHLVFTVRRGLHVVGRCGRWTGSEPLGNPKRNPTVESAKQRLRDGICNLHRSEETITKGT